MKLCTNVLFNGSCYIEKDINPADFLDFEEDELCGEIYLLMTEFNAGECEIDDIYNEDFTLPDEFIEKWRQLKILQECL